MSLAKGCFSRRTKADSVADFDSFGVQGFCPRYPLRSHDHRSPTLTLPTTRGLLISGPAVPTILR